MIRRLAQVLGTEEDGLLNAILAAAGTDHYRSGWTKKLVRFDNATTGVVEHGETGWAAGVVCGPAELVAGRMVGPVVTRFTFARDGVADRHGSVLLHAVSGVEAELPCPQATLVELLNG